MSEADIPRFVVDASVAVKWLLQDEDLTDEALAILADYQSGRVALIGPDHLYYEIANATRTAVRQSRLSAVEGLMALEPFLALDTPTVGGQSLLLNGYAAALDFECALYDGLYLALADYASCPLIHADRRLRNTLRGRFGHELWIQNYAV